MSWWRWQGDDLVLQIKVQPRAPRDAFVGMIGGRQKVQIRAPAVEGRANAELIDWLAVQFGVTRRAVSIETGLTSLLKRVRVAAPQRLPEGIARTGD